MQSFSTILSTQHDKLRLLGVSSSIFECKFTKITQTVFSLLIFLFAYFTHYPHPP